MKTRSILITCAAVLFPFISAPASAEVISFSAASAVSDPDLAGSNNDHSIWLPFFENIAGTPLAGNSNGSDFDFEPDGIFTQAHGIATLTGTIRSQVDPTFAFNVTYNFEASSGPGSNGPKLELFQSAYINNGGPIDPYTWQFFDFSGGSFTGLGSLAGLNLDVLERPAGGLYPLQFGEGANGKNGNLGAAVWFSLVTGSDCTNDLCNDLAGQTLRGDVNVDLSPVPVPGAFLLMASGLAGFGFSRRKKTA